MFAVAGAAWRNTFEAVRYLPTLFGSGFVLLLALQLLWAWLSMTLGLPTPWMYPEVAPSPSDLSGMALLGVAVSVFAAWIQAPIAVSVHRYILLAEVRDRAAIPSTSRDRRFAVWLIAVVLLAELPRLVLQIILIDHPLLGAAAVIPALLAVAIVGLRLTLVFPAVALDEHDAPMRGWHLSKGHAWQILWTGFVVGSPIALPTILVLVFSQGHLKPAVICLVTSLSMTFSISALAAMASIYFRLYKRPV